MGETLNTEKSVLSASAGMAEESTGKIRILMLEDSDNDAELTERELCRGKVCFQSKRVMTRPDFEREVSEFRPDIVLGDYALPAYDGLSALAFVLNHFPDIPFIFVSGTMGEEFAVAGLKKGATDYILKNQLARLVPALYRALQEAEERKEKQKAREALHESEKRYKRLIESVTDYIYTVYLQDGKPEKTTHGTGCVAVTGYTAEEYDRDPYLWYRMIHDEDRGAVTKQAGDILAGKGVPLEHRLIHKNGSVRWVRNTPVPRCDDRKQFISYDGLVVDITDRKNAEEKLLKYQETLEVKVLERTRELNEARRLAEAASQSKSDFLANMSHELRTPLNSVLGFSDVLLDELFGKLNEKQHEYIGNISDSGKHLLQIINDILDLSKVESGRMELELAAFPVKKTLESSLAMLAERAMRQKITIDLAVSPDADLTIVADERKFKQVMYNLLSNAVKFTGEGGAVRVSARLTMDDGRRTMDDGRGTSDEGVVRLSEQSERSAIVSRELDDHPSSLEVSVTDTGIGITAGDMGKLFKEFTQLESSLTKNYEGTGLGLALTKRLVELHGGSIRAASEPGKGSAFTFILPLKATATDSSPRVDTDVH